MGPRNTLVFFSPTCASGTVSTMPDPDAYHVDYHLPFGLPGPLKLSTLSESAAAHGGAEAAQGRSRALSPAALPARPQVSPCGPSCGVVIRRCRTPRRHRQLRTYAANFDIRARISLGSHLDIADSGLLICFCVRTRVHCSRRHFCGPAVSHLRSAGRRRAQLGL